MIKPRLQPLAMLAALLLLTLLLLPAPANYLVATNSVTAPATATLTGAAGQFRVTLYLLNGSTPEPLAGATAVWSITSTADGAPITTVTGAVVAANAVRCQASLSVAGLYSGVVRITPAGGSPYVAGRQTIAVTNATQVAVTINAATNSISVTNNVAVTNSFNITGVTINSTNNNSITIVTATNSDAATFGGRDTNWWRDASNQTNPATVTVVGFGVSTSMVGRATTYTVGPLPATGSYGIVQWDGAGYYVSPFVVAPTGGALNIAYFTNQVQFGALASTSTADQSWSVPAGLTQLVVECIGGGGGGGQAAGGGAGGYARNTIDVVPGEILTIRVGQGGRYNSSVGSVPGGGIGALGLNGAGTYYCGNGGGYSAVLRGTNVLCLAAGGGGGSGGAGSVSGGSGGGSSGASGNANAGYGTNRVAGGGSKVSGGTNGVGATVGAFLAGGNGGTNAYSHCGGGGGAGWFGGGGGGATSSGNNSGAGGACYAPAPYGSLVRGPNTGADNYQSPWGNGGSSTTAGSDGRVIVSYP